VLAVVQGRGERTIPDPWTDAPPLAPEDEHEHEDDTENEPARKPRAF